MRTWFLLAGLTCMMFGAAQADTIHLKNGNTVEGKVIEKTEDGVKVDIGGVTLTYYADEIVSIEAASNQATPAVPAAVEAKAKEPVVPAVAETPAVVEKVDPPVVAAPVSEPVAVPVAPAVVEAPAVAPLDAAPPVAEDLANLSKNDLIKKFVQIYGVKENMQANFDQMTSTLKADQAEAFRQSVKVDQIVELLLPIYDKHFTADDLRAYIRFYGSPEGKKLVQTLPLLMKDSVDVSMQYLDAHLPESLKQEQAAASGN